MTRFALSLFAFAILVVPAFAEKNVAFEPKLATVGSPVITESFDGPLGKSFQAVKGRWQITDGVLVGTELAADKHAAVLNLQKKNRNSVVRFSFKLDGKTKGCHFSLNRTGGHLFRCVVTPTKLTINLDKDKKNPESKPKVLATAKGQFQQGQWHTMQIEMVGDRVVVQADNGIIAKVKHEKLNVEKPNYRFVMRGDGLSVDDLHVWDVK